MLYLVFNCVTEKYGVCKRFRRKKFEWMKWNEMSWQNGSYKWPQFGRSDEKLSKNMEFIWNGFVPMNWSPFSVRLLNKLTRQIEMEMEWNQMILCFSFPLGNHLI